MLSEKFAELEAAVATLGEKEDVLVECEKALKAATADRDKTAQAARNLKAEIQADMQALIPDGGARVRSS